MVFGYREKYKGYRSTNLKEKRFILILDTTNKNK